MPKVKVTVDRSKCVSCGAAPSICPEVYVLGDDNGKNRVVDKYSVQLTDEVSVGIIPEELAECAINGADACPVEAIKVETIE
ncbi:MAG: ferredoxin [Thermofilaceae archaeon]|nr:ferredoxin [Thermofilaceae archaeon]MCX8181018.1 ferredoxin [Thermofilaceae archaeon]MDW8004122.1 ferredoxin [Thermofilaceae archaeon]